MDTVTLSDVVTFDAAAKALSAEGCRIGRDRVAELAFKYEIGIPWNLSGGHRRKRPRKTGQTRQWWRVKLSDLRDAILRERSGPVTPPSTSAPQRPARSGRTPTRGSSPLHPRVAC